jgi:hypothetical protein
VSKSKVLREETEGAWIDGWAYWHCVYQMQELYEKKENTAQLVDHFQVFLQEWAERNRKTIGEYYDTENGVAQQGL